MPSLLHLGSIPKVHYSLTVRVAGGSSTAAKSRVKRWRDLLEHGSLITIAQRRQHHTTAKGRSTVSRAPPTRPERHHTALPPETTPAQSPPTPPASLTQPPAMDKDNANPTILTASQLPTRKQARKTSSPGPDARLTGVVVRKPRFLSDPFCDVAWSDTSESDDDDFFTAEPIDEQEIYGESEPRPMTRPCCYPGPSRVSPGIYFSPLPYCFFAASVEAAAVMH